MTDRHYDLIRDLPRRRLEDMAVRFAIEAGKNRRDAASQSYFAALLVGFTAGALVAATGFIVGTLFR